MNSSFPQYDTSERLADFCIHVVGVAGSLIGAIGLLVLTMGTVPAVSAVSLTIYSIGLLAVFLCSAAYNLVSDHTLKDILRRFDHAAIYVKIAATYTPFAAVKIGGWPGGSLLALVWAVAVFGLTIKLLYPERLMKTSYVLYLAQGWAVLLVINPLVASVSGLTLVMLAVGGVLYTVGVGFHLWQKLRYHNAIWHGFVVGGSGCHFFAVVNAIVLS